MDLEADPDWEWHSAGEDNPEELEALWQGAVARPVPSFRRRWPRAAWTTSAGTPRPGVSHPNLRRILIDLIEGVARHVGHADLIRESVDGLTGEDPPG